MEEEGLNPANASAHGTVPTAAEETVPGATESRFNNLLPFSVSTGLLDGVSD